MSRPDVKFRLTQMFAIMTVIAALLSYFRTFRIAYETYGGVESIGWIIATGSIVSIARRGSFLRSDSSNCLYRSDFCMRMGQFCPIC